MRRRGAGTVGLVVAGAAAAGMAPTALGVQISNPVAISAVDALGIASDASCPAYTQRLHTSHDRGATWAPAGCEATILWQADPTPDGVVTTRGNQVVLIGPDGHVAPIAGGVSFTPIMPVASADAGIGAYAVGTESGSPSVWHAYRFVTGSGWERCPSEPAWPSDRTGGTLRRSGSLLVASSDPVGESGQGWVWTSTDRCATWTAARLPVGRRLVQLDAAGRLHAGTVAAGMVSYSVSADRGIAWTDRDVPTASGMWPEDGSLRRFRLLDDPRIAGLPFYPAGWPALTTAGPVDAPAPVAPAYAFVNSRYRVPMGLTPLRYDALLSRAAANHVAYWALSGVGAGLSAHNETPGTAGFTGGGPSDRCIAAGYGMGCGEVAYPSIADIEAATRGWLGTPFHGAPLLWANAAGFAAGAAGSVGNTAGGRVQERLDLDAASNTPTGPLHVWPADGMGDVPTRWTGGELPDPLESYTGDHADIGPVLFVGASIAPAMVTLTGPTGPVPLLRPNAAAATPTGTVDYPGVFWAFFAAHALRAGSAYTLVVTSPQGSYTSHFTTAPAMGGDDVVPGTGDEGATRARRGSRTSATWPRGVWRRWRARTVTARVTAASGSPTGSCRAELRTARGRWGLLAIAGLTRRGTCTLRVTLNGRVQTMRVRYTGSSAYLASTSATRTVRVR